MNSSAKRDSDGHAVSSLRRCAATAAVTAATRTPARRCLRTRSCVGWSSGAGGCAGAATGLDSGAASPSPEPVTSQVSAATGSTSPRRPGSTEPGRPPARPRSGGRPPASADSSGNRLRTNAATPDTYAAAKLEPLSPNSCPWSLGSALARPPPSALLDRRDVLAGRGDAHPRARHRELRRPSAGRRAIRPTARTAATPTESTPSHP